MQAIRGLHSQPWIIYFWLRVVETTRHIGLE